MGDVGEDPALIGRSIAGKFVVEKFLGGGAMGAVYRARQTALEKNVAVKVMHREVASDAQFAARFHREAKAASRLDHPNSMRVIDFGEEPDGLLYIAMEYLEGRDLYKVIHEDWPISDARIVDVLSQALAALAVAHDMGVIHRDLKPENIMILRGKDDEGREADVVKVCDFGIAKIQEKEDTAAATVPTSTPTGPMPEGKKLTTAGLVVGTPEYMSPEQARGEKLDTRSDIYAMGVILFQLLTGRTPFTGDNALAVVVKHITEEPPAPRTIYAGVNQSLEAICLKAMAKAPASRFQSAREMRTALRSSADARPTPVDVNAPTMDAPISAASLRAVESAPTIAAMPALTTNAAVVGTELPPKPPKKRSAAAIVAGLVVLSGIAAGAIFIVTKKEADTHATPVSTTPSSATAAPKTAEGAISALPPPGSLALNTAAPPPIAPDPATPSAQPVKHATTSPSPKNSGKSAAGTSTAAEPEPPAPAPAPDPVPPPTVTPPPATTTQAPPPPAPAPAPAFNAGTCRAQQTNIVPHGVSKQDLAMRGTVDAWSACARSSIRERPAGPITATVHLQFTDTRGFRGATCAGCPGALAACIASTTGRTVSLQFKSGDVTGDPSFDVGVTFMCD